MGISTPNVGKQFVGYVFVLKAFPFGWTSRFFTIMAIVNRGGATDSPQKTGLL